MYFASIDFLINAVFKQRKKKKIGEFTNIYYIILKFTDRTIVFLEIKEI